MKFAYKVIKNKKNVKSGKSKLSDKSFVTGVSAGVISFILVAKVTLGFRECAAIVKIANGTDCKVEIASGTKTGTSESILSLVALGISADKSLVMTVKGERNEEAFREISKILTGKVKA